MQSTNTEFQVKATGQANNIQISQQEKKVQIKPVLQRQPRSLPNKQLLMKLYVYGSCESDQFRHPNKQSQSKRPICLTNIEKFDLNDDEDDEDSQNKDKKDNIYLNPLYQKSVAKIACGGLHSVVLTSDGKAYTFGCNDQGALGRKGPQCIPLEVELDHPVDLVSAGDNHTMFANSINGIVYFTGNYNYLRGEKMIENVTVPIKFNTVSLDIRNKNQPIQKLVSGANHTCILINNRIFCRGEPESFTTGRRINERRKTENSLTFDGVGLNNVTDVWCGGYHSVAKVKKGKDFVYHTWGKNDQGQLGVGNFQSQAFPIEIKRLRGKNIVKVAAGTFFTLFLTESGEIFGCGSTEYGQLGLGQDYEFVASEGEQEQEQEQDLEDHVQKMRIDQHSKMQDVQEGEQVAKQGNKMQIQNQRVDDKKQDKQQQKVQKKRYQQKNTYIRSPRQLSFPQQTYPKQKITNISSGSQFSFAWNNTTQLYSWGFGMNYVLLNGEQNEEYQPFRVKNKIINDEIIEEIKGGGQHVVYMAYQKIGMGVRPNVQLQKRVTMLVGGERNRLSRKKKN